MIVKTDGYNREQVARVVSVRANVEGLRLGTGVLDKLASEGERSSLRYVDDLCS
jgi:RuvB-like protein 1 (pontin 52)